MDTLNQFVHKWEESLTQDAVLKRRIEHIQSALEEGSEVLEVDIEERGVFTISLEEKKFYLKSRKTSKPHLEDVASSLNLKIENDLLGLTGAGERILNEISYPMGSLNQNRYKGGWNPIFCYTIMGNLSSFYKFITTAAEKYKYPSGDIGFLILPLNHGATFYFEPSFYRDPKDGEESQSVETLFLEVSNRLIHEGAFLIAPITFGQKRCMGVLRTITVK